MSTRTLMAVSAALVIPALMWAQQATYPMTIVPTGKGPYTFPPGYQTPWDKIDIRVTEKMSPNLFVLHGSEGLDPAHPDASGWAGSSPCVPCSTNRLGDIFSVTRMSILSHGV